jgi:hypothetical protein
MKNIYSYNTIGLNIEYSFEYSVNNPIYQTFTVVNEYS